MKFGIRRRYMPHFSPQLALQRHTWMALLAIMVPS